LLQSHAGYVHLLPAIPDQWRKEGEVRGLKARGNLLVDFTWKDGRVSVYTIHSRRPQTIKVKINGELKDVRTIGYR
jgi:alpha-L-fucosidase 2